MQIEMNKISQKQLDKCIEINNINNNEMSEVSVVQKIAKSANVSLDERDISNAYKIKKQKQNHC